ncbi:MAG TPA: hypothetical protein VJU77_10775 [Chthoniobacterales bacterium]|nr:hypothetical protein [Chthoniobacterales bacterium]
MPPPQPSRARQIVAWIAVTVIVLAVWKYVDYRNQPPPVTKTVTSDK